MSKCTTCDKKFGWLFGASRAKSLDITAARKKGIEVSDDICRECLDVLNKKEQAIREKRARDIVEIEDMIEHEILAETPVDVIFSKTQEASNHLELTDEHIKKIICGSVGRVAMNDMDNGVFSEERERQILSLFQQYKIQSNDISKTIMRVLAQGKVLRDLLNCNKSQSFSSDGLPFNFQKTEMLIWAWANMQIATPKTTSKVVGKSLGFSIRIMKGIYIRPGAFEGQRVSETSIVPIGYGVVAITSKNLYYTVKNQTKRIKHEKIVSIEPYSDAICVSTDNMRDNTFYFYSDEPEFFANILQNAKNWE